jgi:hypothetical protein
VVGAGGAGKGGGGGDGEEKHRLAGRAKEHLLTGVFTIYNYFLLFSGTRQFRAFSIGSLHIITWQYNCKLSSSLQALSRGY